MGYETISPKGDVMILSLLNSGIEVHHSPPSRPSTPFVERLSGVGRRAGLVRRRPVDHISRPGHGDAYADLDSQADKPEREQHQHGQGTVLKEDFLYTDDTTNVGAVSVSVC